MQRKPRVLHIITRLIIGGAQENTVLTVQGLRRGGRYEVDLASGPSLGPEGSMVEELTSSGIDIISIPYLRREINPLYDFIAFWHIFFIIKKGGYDIVHTHSSKAGVLGRLAAKLAGVKIIIHTIHGLAFHPYQPRLWNYIYRLCEKLLAPLTDKMIAVSKAMVEQARRGGVGPGRKLVVIYSGLDLEKFKPRSVDFKLRKSHGLSEEDIVIGKIARLFHLKGHSFLLKAVSNLILPVSTLSKPRALAQGASNGLIPQFPHLKILLVGDGLLRPELEKEANELGLKDKVIFTGLVKRDSIPEMIALMDVVVHTSLREGLARVIPQAMAMEKPVIAFDLDGSREVIEDGVNGFLVRAGDVEALTQTLNSVLSDIPRLREMGKAGRRKIEPDFDKDYMVRQIEGVYK